MSLTAPERETIVTMNDEDDFAEIWTAQRPRITALKKNPSAELLEEGKIESSVWARFRLPSGLVSFRSVRVKHELSEEQRRERAERMRSLRSNSNRAALES